MQIAFTKQIKIKPIHLDGNNHVNNVQYVHWVEEVAAEHWDILKFKTDYANDYWMLIDHHIEYKKQVYLNDILTVKTYPEAPEGIRQPRKVEFYCDDILVVNSRTVWLLIDEKTRRIKRLENDWLNRHF